jgi:glycyl-tRNA synthetase alpha subunit
VKSRVYIPKPRNSVEVYAASAMHVGTEDEMLQVESRLRRGEWESRLFGENHLGLLVWRKGKD